MISTTSNKLKAIVLGAINGFIFGASVEVILRLLYFYERYLERNYLPHIHLSLPSPYPFENWWFLALLSFICATVAAFIVQQYFSQHIKSTTLFWQMVGVGSLLLCAVYSMLSISYNVYFSKFSFTKADVLLAFEGDLIVLLFITPFIAIFNLFFASVLKWQRLNLP